MKFICNGCDKPCILDAGDYPELTADSLRCVVHINHLCEWEKYEDGEAANLQPTCNNLATDLQDKPLPKLTTEVFDRPDCPYWAKIAVVNSNGKAYYGNYSYAEPHESGGWTGFCNTKGQWKRIGNELFEASDWEKSLIERPAKALLDWCKVGEWVWATTFNIYFKVDKVDALFIGGKDLSGNGYSVKLENLRRARLRPYNAEEMKALVGKIICEANASHIATTCIHHDGKDYLHLGTHLYEAEELIAKGFTIDGNPCGVLQHIENGEWVK